MRKYILTESQIKKVVDTVIAEQVNDQASLIASLRCFLNQVLKTRLDPSGPINDNGMTTQALKTFQQKIGAEPDGVWGYRTQNLIEQSKYANIWIKCRNQYNLS